jgi:two-component system, chemotaxis family, chemotaxis protein CheY
MIRMDVCSRVPAHMAPTPNDSRALRPLCVLVAEDNDVVRQTILFFLMKTGMSVHGTADGFEALRCWQANPEVYDVLITDHSMPVMNGIELVREIRRCLPAGSDLKIIVYSGRLEAADIDDYLALQVVRVIQKPCLPEELIAAVLAPQNTPKVIYEVGPTTR